MENNIAEYYQARCAEIGLTEEQNKLLTKEHKALENSNVIEYALLDYDKKTGDLLIPVYALDGHPVNYYKDNSGKLQNGKTKELIIRRFAPQNLTDDKPKYLTPKGATTYPWISPNIIYDYQAKKEIHTIVITEGAIKGIAGYLNGMHIFAMSGIQNYKDKHTGQLHTAIQEVIKTCNVKNVILLYDGDCNQISLKAIHEEKDLYTRPYGFFSSARGINELLKEFKTQDKSIDVFFAHVDTSNMEGNPKGLDDLYNAFPEEKAEITKELISFGKTKLTFFHRFDITFNINKLYGYFHLKTAEDFYLQYNQIIKDKVFVFNGTKYMFDSFKQELNIVVPGSAKQYCRVGDNYYEYVSIPNKYGVLEVQLHKRLSSTIIQDHGKNLLNHIPKYKAFCNKPDHVNYQQIIDNCFNRYSPFEHTPAETDECPTILSFVKHIFGEQYELGLDYIQLLYQKPTQKLPILCLVSKENNTGKSTFGQLLKAIFTGNMAIIGNADLENDFNAGWASKLIICCEESFIDKKKTVERIKALSTGDKITLNQKGIDQAEIDFFGKFIFMSNNENNFVIANEHDERYWVRKVPKAQVENVNLMDQMLEEIENFLCFLNKRKLSTKRSGRMWFHKNEIKTDALANLISHNKSAAEKEITSYLRNLFLEVGFMEIKLTIKTIVEVVLRRRFESNYIEGILKEKMKLKPSEKTFRFEYPDVQKVFDNGKISEEVKLVKNSGRPITFKAEDFCTPEEVASIDLCEAAIALGQGQAIPKQEALQFDEQENDLPF